MDYANVLRRSWEITWRYKGLWVLGILASCASGGGGGSGGGGNTGFSTDSGNGLPPQVEQFFRGVPEEWIVAAVVLIVLLALLVALIAFVVGVLGQGGLIAGFRHADDGNPVTLAEAFRMGLPHFWRLLAIQLIIGLALLVVILVVAGGAILTALATFGIGLICLIPLICVLIPLAIGVSVYTVLAKVAVVVDSLDVFAALRKAWEVLRANLGPMALMAVILLLGGGLIGALLAAPFLVVVLPVLGGLAFGTDEALFTGIGLAALCFVLYLPVLIVLDGILQTFIHGAWTITYRRLTGAAGAASLAAAE